jgi:hypothetical protein
LFYLDLIGRAVGPVLDAHGKPPETVFRVQRPFPVGELGPGGVIH